MPDCRTSRYISWRSSRGSGQVPRARTNRHPVFMRTSIPPLSEPKARRPRVATHWQTHRHRIGRRSLARPPSDDRRPPALEGAGAKLAGKICSLPSTSPTARSRSPKPAQSTGPRSTSSPARNSRARPPAASKCSPAISLRFAPRSQSRITPSSARSPTRATQRHRQRLFRRNPSPAQLSPILHTQKMSRRQWDRLFAATRITLKLWTDHLSADAKKASRKKSPCSAPKWPSTANSASPARVAAEDPAHPLRRKRNQLLPQLPNAEGCSPTAAFLGDFSAADWPRSLDEFKR